MQVTPEVGMGATKVLGSDCYPFTIVQVIDQKKIVVQEDDARLTEGSGMSEHQVYEYTPNTSAPLITLSKRKNGAWVPVGEAMHNGAPYAIGHRRHYLDPSF